MRDFVTNYSWHLLIQPKTIHIVRLLPNQKILDITPKNLPRFSQTYPFMWKLCWELAENGKHSFPFYRTVTFHFNDKHFVMRLDMTKIPECGYYFRDPTATLTEIISRGGQTMLDIGANVGFHSISAGLKFDKVFAFEPTPSTFERLSENIRLSNAKNVFAHNLALSSKETNVQLWTNPLNCGANSLKPLLQIDKYDSTPIEVKAISLDDFVNKQNIANVDLIKIDVEGYEPDVLAGAINTLERDRPVLFVEILAAELLDKIKEIIPGDYQAWNPLEKSIIRDSSLTETALKIRDIIFSVGNPYCR
ncbi:MAG: FkbM family methyltransferase [Pseudomonadota bacterium]